MPKFVWEQMARGHWAPAVFSGELPREMTMPHNSDRYRVHVLSEFHVRMADEVTARGASALDYLAHVHPAPPPHTGKE